MKKFFFDCGTRDATASFGFFVLRVLIGLMILVGHGIPQFQNYTTRKESFYVPDIFPLSLLSPSMSLIACISAELIASTLIIIGLATRSAAFVLAFCLVVISFGAQSASPWFLNSAPLSETKELSLMYLIPMLTIILAGAGAYSLDAGLYRESKRRRW